MTDMQAHAHNEHAKAAVRKPVVVLTIDEAQARITQLENDTRALTAKLDICHRYAMMEGAEGDFGQLANDYGGTQWERDARVAAVHILQQRVLMLEAALVAATRHDTSKE